MTYFEPFTIVHRTLHLLGSFLSGLISTVALFAISDGTSARTKPAWKVPETTALLEEQLSLETVLYVPLEFDKSTSVRVQLIVNKLGTDVTNIHNEVHEQDCSVGGGDSTNHTGIRGADSKNISEDFVTMEAHCVPSANGSVLSRVFSLDSINNLIGACTLCALRYSNACCYRSDQSSGVQLRDAEMSPRALDLLAVHVLRSACDTKPQCMELHLCVDSTPDPCKMCVCSKCWHSGSRCRRLSR